MVRLDQLFDVKNGIASSHVVVLGKPKAGTIPYVRPAKNQQRTIAGWVEKNTVPARHCHPKHTIFVSTNGEGSHTYAYVSDFEFVANSDVSILLPKQKMTLAEKIFYAKAISLNRSKFSYGRKPKGERLKSIKLPDHPPAWVAHTVHHIKPFSFSVSTSFARKKTKLNKPIDLKTVPLIDLFEVQYGTDLGLIYLIKNPQGINFVARTSQNNGVAARVQRLYDVEPTEGMVLTVAGGGSVLETFLQIDPFYSGHDLFVLKPKCPMTIDEMLYYATCIKANQYKYSYGRQANKTLRELPIPAYESIPQWVYGAIKRAATDFTHLLQIAE
ncbi:putative Restriction enzyme beta subunit [Candidatus Glomeribacter gigasporarum BEG34]|uniref:Putative Restriction enzyme beta subunit n=1 Tax=Candidatus Glomeribacter gigasporarum BEG34 TaxID=1070319 RepID=G2J8H6_9BURK|nr:putative Restriction enzyme beta subunit [Candidatus Glomeribacter gigasporarum BEG34]